MYSFAYSYVRQVDVLCHPSLGHKMISSFVRTGEGQKRTQSKAECHKRPLQCGRIDTRITPLIQKPDQLVVAKQRKNNTGKQDFWFICMPRALATIVSIQTSAAQVTSQKTLSQLPSPSISWSLEMRDSVQGLRGAEMWQVAFSVRVRTE